MAGNPLLNPNAPLSGNALLQAAKALVSAQVGGPYSELARQLTQNQARGAEAQRLTGGYFNQLGQFAQQGYNDQTQIANDLNAQLSRIGGDQSAALGQIGSDAQASMAKYSPGASGQQPGSQALAGEIARQQGVSAQTQGAFQASGAKQGANYRGLSASNLGTFGLMGQERLGQIAQANQLANEPIQAKMAALSESKGALLTKFLGQLRQQEISNQVTKQGLGIRQQAANTTASNDRANRKLRLFGINSANARNAATIRAANSRNAASNATRQGIANARAGGVGAAGTRPLTTNEQNRIYTEIDNIQSLIKQARGKGHTGNAVRQALQTGTYSRGTPKYNSVLVDAAYELMGWGHILPKTAAALHAMGLRGGRYRVAPAPRQSPASQALGAFGF